MQDSTLTDTRTIKANCLCGSAAHELLLPASAFPLKSVFCHCESCRHMLGTLCFTDVRLPRSHQPDQSLLDKLTAYRFSQRLVQYHCGTCGAFVISQDETADPINPSLPFQWHISSGTLEEYDGILQLSSQIFIKDTRDGGMAKLLAPTAASNPMRFTHREGSEVLPPAWAEPGDVARNASDRLHAHCKCGGVDFYVKPPPLQPTQEPRPKATSTGEMCNPAVAEWLRANKGKYLACHCVCNSCRRAVGHEFTSWVFMPTADITLDAEGTKPFRLPFGSLKMYKSSPPNERYFCSTCGAMTFFKANGREGFIDVAAGLFASPEGALSQNWFEWQTARVGFPEDAASRAKSLLDSLEHGLSLLR